MKVLIVNLAAISLILLFGTVGKASSEDLALYLPFDEGEGELAQDQSPKGNDGILHGVSWTEDGRYGSAVEFSGEAGVWVEVPDSSSLDITDEITLMLWVYPTQFTDEWSRLIVKTWEGDVAPYMVYGIYQQNGNQIGFIVSIDGATDFSWCDVTPQLQTNEWTHVAATYDGEMQRIYYNGEVKAENAVSGKIDTNDVPVSIGRNNLGNREHYIGILDEVAIFSRALTESEIKQSMEQIALIEPSEKLPITWGSIKRQF